MEQEGDSHRWSISSLCKKLQMSRQNYYAARRRRGKRLIEEEFILELVKAERCLQPRLGCRKLLKILHSPLEEAEVRIGRDRFIELLKEYDLLVEPVRATSPRTTSSRHYLPVFSNRLKDMNLTGPNQAWVADITYIRTREGFLYLSLITDAFSRKIVGYHVGDSLEVVGCLMALEMAIRGLPAGCMVVHHSDRGSQYCSHAYFDSCEAAGIQLSMTEQLHVYENAKAERVNGILKLEYGLRFEFADKASARQAVEQAVYLYNCRRPHCALNYRTPVEVHEEAA